MASAYGWSFLVARGRHTGYQTLLAPDFLAESNEYGVLGEATGADAETAITRLHGLAAGDVVLAYRTQRLTDADLGAAAGGPLTDEFGRPLELMYGFAVRAAAIGVVDDADFDQARAEAISTYQQFLADESGFRLETARAFALRSTPAAAEPAPAPAPIRPAPVMVPAASFAAPAPVAALPVSPRSPRRYVVLAGVLGVAIVFSAWLLLRGGGQVTQVKITDLAAVVDCSQLITVQGTITTDDDASVTYHWESTLPTNSSPTDTDFPDAGSYPVEGTVDPTGKESGATFKVTQKLVVEEPNFLVADQVFTLTCK
ncbi:hypothetical protein [Kribbella sp. NPDC055071]